MSTPDLDAELLVYNLESFPGEIRNWAPYMEDKTRPKKGRPLQNSRWQFNKQENLHTRLVLGTKG